MDLSLRRISCARNQLRLVTGGEKLEVVAKQPGMADLGQFPELPQLRGMRATPASRAMSSQLRTTGPASEPFVLTKRLTLQPGAHTVLSRDEGGLIEQLEGVPLPVVVKLNLVTALSGSYGLLHAQTRAAHR